MPLRMENLVISGLEIGQNITYSLDDFTVELATRYAEDILNSVQHGLLLAVSNFP